MDKEKRKDIEEEHPEEFYKAQASASFGVFILVAILIILLILAFIGIFLANFANS